MPNTTEKNRVYQAAWYQRNREKKLAQNRVWREANKERKAATNLAWQERNSAHYKELLRNHYVKNKDRYRARYKEWCSANPDKVAEIAARKRAIRQQAMPSWADAAAIKAIYAEAAASGLHVDHIVPLRSKIVCGLHVAANLQPLPPVANRRKSNVWWPDMAVSA